MKLLHQFRGVEKSSFFTFEKTLENQLDFHMNFLRFLARFENVAFRNLIGATHPDESLLPPPILFKIFCWFFRFHFFGTLRFWCQHAFSCIFRFCFFRLASFVAGPFLLRASGNSSRASRFSQPPPNENWKCTEKNCTDAREFFLKIFWWKLKGPSEARFPGAREMREPEIDGNQRKTENQRKLRKIREIPKNQRKFWKIRRKTLKS